MYKFIGRPGKMYSLDSENIAMKLNYNCPDSEKNGTGPGSCGGSSKQESTNDNNNYFLDDDNNKILEVPQINEKIYDDAIKSQDDLDSASGTRNINYYTSHSKKDIIDYNNSLSFNEYKALHENWVGTGWSTPINEILRKSKSFDNINPETKNVIKSLDSAISKFKINNNIKTYRGITGVKQLLKQKVGSTFKDKGFIGTTENINHAKSFLSANKNDAIKEGAVLLRINVPRGTSCAPTSIVNTEFLGEREWTLPRETSFKVTKNFIDKETGITYLDVDVVLDKKNKKV